jgi:hypothetical protein
MNQHLIFNENIKYYDLITFMKKVIFDPFTAIIRGP